MDRNIEAIARDLNLILRGEYCKPLVRGVRAYGASGVGFCLERQVLQKRAEKPFVTNGKMLVGKELHRAMFRFLVRQHFDIKRWQRWRVKFEPVARYSDPRGFHIEGHVDADLPRQDATIEFKTTFSTLGYARGQFITEAYIEQANAYAVMMGRKWWEIWVLHLSQEDVEHDEMFSVLRGPADPDAFRDFLDRVWLVDEAIQESRNLTGPEQGWECKRCEYLLECPLHDRVIDSLIAKLPCRKAALSEEEQAELEILKRHGIASYDRSARTWSAVGLPARGDGGGGHE